MIPTLISALAIGKISLGVTGILAPLLSHQAFLLTLPSTTSVLLRLVSSRELALGGLVWYNRLRNPTNAAVPPSTKRNSTTMLSQALMAGIAVDSLDAVSALACYSQGALDGTQTLVLGAGGIFAAGWGWFCLKGVGRLGLRA
jgi:hypothetical protein